jgi:hypothetical protein
MIDSFGACGGRNEAPLMPGSLPAEAVQKRARLFVFSQCRRERSIFFATECWSSS